METKGQDERCGLRFVLCDEAIPNKNYRRNCIACCLLSYTTSNHVTRTYICTYVDDT